MATHLVQIVRGVERRVALVNDADLILLEGFESAYALAMHCIESGRRLSEAAREHATGERLPYDEIHGGRSAWKLLVPFDVPGAPEKMLVAGTGLTHLGSAKDRQAMHLATAHDAGKPVTDSMRMFELGLQGGRPQEGEIGAAPEWFYKGDGGVLRAPFESLDVPAHGEDGGEEAELAGIYLIAADGMPVRVGMCQGNEFSDHIFERRNYLNLAGSKLRACSIGPELVVDAPFGDVKGQVAIERDGKVIWQKDIETGEGNMAHSLANLEHHHFKFAGHRVPGHAHVHFFGAHSLSFGEGLVLQDGDAMRVHFEGYGRPLTNGLERSDAAQRLVRVRSLS